MAGSAAGPGPARRLLRGGQRAPPAGRVCGQCRSGRCAPTGPRMLPALRWSPARAYRGVRGAGAAAGSYLASSCGRGCDKHCSRSLSGSTFGTLLLPTSHLNSICPCPAQQHGMVKQASLACPPGPSDVRRLSVAVGTCTADLVPIADPTRVWAWPIALHPCDAMHPPIGSREHTASSGAEPPAEWR